MSAMEQMETPNMVLPIQTKFEREEPKVDDKWTHLRIYKKSVPELNMIKTHESIKTDAELVERLIQAYWERPT